MELLVDDAPHAGFPLCFLVNIASPGRGQNTVVLGDVKSDGNGPEVFFLLRFKVSVVPLRVGPDLQG